MTTKLDWPQTVARIHSDIPATKNVNWEALFRNDPKILGDIVNDIIKISVSQRGRPGKRSAGSEADVAADLRKLTNTDYAEVPFPEALRYAMGSRSLRQTALLSGIDKMTVHRLLKGEGAPVTMSQMEAFAAALKKDPSYFIEYRATFVCSVLYDMLCENNESAVVFYKKLKG